MYTKKVSILTCLLLLTGLCAIGLFSLLYRFDNKYIMRASLSQEGFSVIKGDSSDPRKITYLAEGWEFYPDVEASPDELSDYTSKEIYIGQYFSFSSFHKNHSPYGSGTYRIVLTGKSGSYSLLLPEVFSACNVYVNGELTASAGSLSPYRPLIKDTIVTVPLENRQAEVVVQTANHSHYYSGVTYPPAVGSSEAVSRLISERMIFYGFLCFTSLTLALFSSAVWIGLRHDPRSRENFFLGILALSFSIRICYPFLRLAGVPLIRPLYALEDAMAALGIFCIIRIVSLVCLKRGLLSDRILPGISLGFVALSAAAPMVIVPLLPAFAAVYGQLLFWYKLIISLFLFFLVLKHLTGKSSENFPLLAGIGFYALSLCAHMLCLGRYEPARTGWYDEWGIYGLILLFSVRMVIHNIRIVRENIRLNRHLQEEVEHKTASLNSLLEERRQLLLGFAHDLKTPITSITTFTRLAQMEQPDLSDETKQYLDTIRQKAGEMRDRLVLLQEFSYQDTPSDFSVVNLTDLIREFYEQNLPDMDVSGIRFLLHISPKEPLFVYGDHIKLISLLQNLAYNAVGFVPAEGKIELFLSLKDDNACIVVRDNGSGIAPENLPHIFEQFFTCRKDGENGGMGLYIAKSIAIEHGGSISASSTPGCGTSFTVSLPVFHKPDLS